MKFTYNWLKDHLDTAASIADVAERLNAIGLEVEGIDSPADKLAGFQIARVLTAMPHPQADKLQVLTVDAGEGAVQVVCGAPNARAGLVGILGAPGAVVPANGMILKAAAIRGVESHGMMCSSRELELGDDHDGIVELPDDAPIGEAYAKWAGLDDAVFDVSVLPNRQDCMGVRGIARDLAAAGLGTLKPLAVPVVDGNSPSKIEIGIEDAEGCPAFYGRTISGVRNGAAPGWMARRLNAIGQRSISALVDITNYVMFDLGRPSHAYDLAKLAGPVVARRAIANESVTALNGRDFVLNDTMTVIADAHGVHDIAGIMGGEKSGVSDTTSDILLEVAYFSPERIARTGQALSLTSDARTRFERGVDPAFLDDAAAILTALVVAHCGGTPSTLVRAGNPPIDRKMIPYDTRLCARLGGVDVAADQQRTILSSLGFEVTDDWDVVVPTWRRDIDGPADLVEEIVRIVGLGHVVSVPLARADGVARPTATSSQKQERRVRRVAASRGLNEAITWSFISQADAALFPGGHWTLSNPISEELKVMRPSLLPGLLSATRRNLDRGADSVRLFEIGRRYLIDAERPTAGIVLAGERSARGWASGKAQMFDAFDAKAEAIALLEAAGAPIENLQVFGEAGDHFHPGQSGTLRLGPKTILATFGTLHPSTAKAFGLSGSVVACEIYLDQVPAKRETGVMRAHFKPPPLQAVRRDFAFFVPRALASETLVRAVRGVDKSSITDVRLFDVFAAPGIDDGMKSLAIEVTMQPTVKSFTEQELAALAEKIIAAADKLGAKLRG